MIIRDALRLPNIDRLDAEVLLSHVLGRSRSWLAAHDLQELTGNANSEFLEAVKRREGGEPVAYITNEKEFYGRGFLVTPFVLIPRPSTETLVEETLRFLKSKEGGTLEADTDITIYSRRLNTQTPELVVDAGTGSGCIAITLLLEGWKGKATAVDLSKGALEIAEENAVRHGVHERMTFIEGDAAEIISNIKEPFVLVSNPPYIPAETPLDITVKDFEPHLALFAGEKGLDVLTPLLKAAKKNRTCTGVVLELRTDQVAEIEKLLA